MIAPLQLLMLVCVLQVVTDEMWEGRQQRFPTNTPTMREYYLLRSLFQEHYPSDCALATVPYVSPSLAPLCVCACVCVCARARARARLLLAHVILCVHVCQASYRTYLVESSSGASADSSADTPTDSA